MAPVSSCRKREENQMERVVRERKTSNVKAEPLIQG
jgi:hypothetical protein